MIDTALFGDWQEELKQRQEMRQFGFNPADLVLNEAHEVELLLRAWFYCGRSRDFFVALYHNLQRMPVLKWLTSAPQPLLKGFFQFIPRYISIRRPNPAELQFLIILYREDLAGWYPDIIASLDEECCQYLVSHSANKQLRRLLKDAMRSLNREKREARFGLSEERLQDSALSGLYGDKNQGLLKALDLIQSSSKNGIGPNYAAHTVKVAKAVFECGLVADSLAILLENFENLSASDLLSDLFGDTQVCKDLAILLRKITPIYAVLEHAPAAAAVYQAVYHRYFEGFPTDDATHYSLVVSDSLLSFSPNYREALQAILKLWQFHDNQETGEEDSGLFSPAGELDFGYLQRLVDNRKYARPQEAFMLVQLALWLHEQDDLQLDTKKAGWIFALCREFWTWVPSRVFFNTRIFRLLAPLLGPSERQTGDRLIAGIENLTEDNLQSELQNRPDLFRKKDRQIARQMLAGIFLGVH